MTTPDELKEWLASGFAIQIEHIAESPKRFRATIPEFAVVGEGETSNAALQRALDQLGEQLARYIRDTETLPDRSYWITQMERQRITPATSESA